MRKGRDPRLNPVAGDVVEKHSSCRVMVRQVVVVEDGKVSFLVCDKHGLPYNGKVKITPLVRWREWAVDAKVNMAINTT